MLFLTYVNHVSVSPTTGNGPTQGHRKTLTRMGIPTTCSRLIPTPVRVSFSLSLSGLISISRVNAHMAYMWVENSTSHHPIVVNSAEI